MKKHKPGEQITWYVIPYKRYIFPLLWLMIVFAYISISAKSQDNKPVERKIYYVGEYRPNMKVYNLHKFIGQLSNWDKFRQATYQLAIELNCQYNYQMTDLHLYDSLMKTFYTESTYKRGQGAINKKSGAKGIIQFLKSTRAKLNVPDDINNYKLHDQIPFVKKYFQHKMRLHKIDPSKINEFIDIYLIVFAPAYSDNDPDTVLYSKKCKSKNRCKCAYHSNRAYDTDKDGKIKKDEVKKYIIGRHFT